MTNNWVDLGLSTAFFVIGANPVENHPASIAHLNSARFDTNGRGRNAALVVVDPRQTRTARMINAGYDSTNPNDMRKHDRYVRIRPGTNIAFVNGVLNSIIEWMYANKATSTVAQNFFAWHNGTSANHRSLGRAYIDDGGFHNRTLNATELAGAKYSHDGGATWVDAPIQNGWPKYSDSRLMVNDADVTGTPGPILTQNQIKFDYQRAILKTASNLADGADWRFTNMPVFAADIDTAGCVFQKLKTHAAKYPAATVATICGCTTADIAAVRDAWIANSRFASSDFDSASATITAAGYRSACIMYAMGATQFTSGSQGVRSYAVIQTLMGNMGRAGGGINALRGIHNVQGSTDMGVLFDLIPAYSGNPGVGQSYADYQNKLFGNRVLPQATTSTAKSAYVETDIAWQQRGFYNMTREWFGNRSVTTAGDIDKLWDLWPKGNGVQHIEAFRRMCPADDSEFVAEYHYTPTADKPRISACVVWGQNPAITEPNQGAVRTGLKNLDLLVVTDMFATETAQCSRKDTGVTYLLPACSHVEEAGSVASSGRWIQWRDRARDPKGTSRSDLELLLKFAKALDTAGAFSHITGQWATMTNSPGTSAYDVLYGKYGWDGTGSMEAVTGVDYEGNTLEGSEYVAEQIYKEMCSPLDGYVGTGAAGFVGGHKGTMWIYSGNKAAGHGAAYNPDEKTNVQPPAFELNPDGTVSTTAITWDVANRAKSRKGEAKYAAQHRQFPRYGWAWLLNRRVLYNNGELPGDVADVFVAPAYLARLWTIAGSNTLADWSWLYRAYNQLSDKPDQSTSAGQIHEYAGRFPGFTEPYETPYDGTGTLPNLVSTWGRNTGAAATEWGGAGASLNLMPGTTPLGTAKDYPLVLTSIRCVEHFQGGPITRNNAANVDCEPDPWIEINSADAIKYGITDGMWVNVVTARGESVTTQEALTAGGALAPVSGWAKGFKARVGVGTLANQRVAPGTVAIPWHWGDRGLGVGSRANDLCIDAGDANTRIPEYKACLCRIEPATP
jgi:formate dehydrogenase major subunit